MKKFDFRPVHFGPDEAKGDPQLSDYFVFVPRYNEILGGSVRYIIGRKGAGKTAVCEKLRQDTEQDPKAFAASLTLREFPLNAVRNLRDRKYQDKAQYVPIWSFLIGVELARLILQDNSAGPPHAARELDAFLRHNFPNDAVGFAETVTTLTEREAKVRVTANWFEGESSSGESASVVESVHYQRVTKILWDRIAQIESDCTYYILMDELDEGYQAGDPNIRLLLLALLRAVEDAHLAFDRTNLRFRPLLVLRSDIYDRLEDNDLNKLDDAVLRLKWDWRPRHPNSLCEVVDARIRATYPEIAGGHSWTSVARDWDPELPRGVDSLWRYMCNRTFERPRDIIKFLKLAQKAKRGSGRLTLRAARKAEGSFSRWLYGEMRDEIHGHLPVWRDAIQCLATRRGAIDVGEFRAALEARAPIKKWLAEGHEVDEIIEILYDFSVVGHLIERSHQAARADFKYRDDERTWNPEFRLVVHWGFHAKLLLSSDIME